ncbi:MAG: phosphate ABC transporter substrate-binding protein PstS [Arenimonas sp.]
MLTQLKRKIAFIGLAAALSFNLQAAESNGAGASFVFPAMTKWSSDYNKATQNRINYQSIGSGGGIAQIKANTVDFGSSDAPMKPADLDQFNLGQFPSVSGGIVPVVNIPGVAAGAMRLDGTVLADIYLTKIKMWNDPAIAELNPQLKLPALPIRVIYRADGSGTTFNFANYLSKMSPEWKTKIGEGTTVRWPGGFGGKGNEGVAAYVKQIKGAIGYVELSYATTNKLSYTAMKNASGAYVQPNLKSIQAASASADWANAKDFYLIVTNAPGAEAWPITATNFIIMSKKPKNAANAKEAVNFFRWVYANGDAAAQQLGYVPLPADLVKRIDAYWAAEFK